MSGYRHKEPVQNSQQSSCLCLWLEPMALTAASLQCQRALRANLEAQKDTQLYWALVCMSQMGDKVRNS